VDFELKVRRRDSFASRFFDEQLSLKYLVSLRDGSSIETTLYEHSLDGRATDVAIDISTMVGCPMRCAFCASAVLDFIRPLEEEEIVGQVRHFYDAGMLQAPQITCSFQGIGEPSAISGRIIDAATTLLRLDSRVVITVSTMASNPRGALAIASAGFPIHNFQFSVTSLDAVPEDRVMPGSPGLTVIAELASQCKDLPNVLKTKVNVVLLDGVNDDEASLDRLVTAFANSGVIVKISSLNETIASGRNLLESSGKSRAEEFVARLRARQVDSYLFGAFRNIHVSCGQLALIG
jgi:23S rRNA (adenine2503-C2)-methyltransferase